MATIIIGSARHDENGKYTGGAAGDQLQESSTNDTSGEVSMQNMYTHSYGWYILRPIVLDYANKMAIFMKAACNNANIGYSQDTTNFISGRAGVVNYGVNTTRKVGSDCSSLVRAVIKSATGKDVGNFTTGNEVSILEASGLFNTKIAYKNQSSTPVYNGDVLVTQKKGHTVVVVSGNPRSVKIDSSSEFDKTIAGYYKTTGNLYLRSGAGTDDSKQQKIAIINSGDKVRNYGYYNIYNGVKWLYVVYGSYKGFCSSKYLTKC